MHLHTCICKCIFWPFIVHNYPKPSYNHWIVISVNIYLVMLSLKFERYTHEFTITVIFITELAIHGLEIVQSQGRAVLKMSRTRGKTRLGHLNLSNYLYFGREIFWVSKSVLISIEETIEINTDLETPGSNINWHNLVFRGPIRRQPFGRGPGYSPTRPYVKMVQSWYSSNLSFEQFCSFLMLWFQPVVNFINILRTDFAPIFLHQKITKANFN